MARIGHILAKLAVAAIVLGSDVSAIGAQIPDELRRAAGSKVMDLVGGRDPLAELGLTQIGDVNRLVEFGCRDLLKITTVVRPVSEIPGLGGYLRGYQYKGIAFSTLVGRREVIQGAVARASALKEWGILGQEPASLADVIHKFGKPSRAEGGVYWYGSDQYETAIVFIRLTAKRVSQIDWSCG